ncbi:MAG TPA: alpha/beta hydrolase [Acidimicrobiales bacterium]|nr:alpha/beta hydrolase [Acidimicrobiales bacterium]
MSTVAADGVDLYYERQGTGPRLLFLNGSGSTIEASRALFSVFGASFDFLTFDARGLGLSGPVTRPYAMADCAADALAVMDAQGWDTACVLGVSFGGMVAQELAVTAPDRVERLALMCTSPGGPDRSSYPLHELEALSPDKRSRTRRQLIDTRFDDAWLDAHPDDRALAEMIESRGPHRDPERRRGELQQLDARRTHDVWERLPAITSPTFIGCGRFDGIAPPANSAAMATAIAGSELHEYEGGHIFFVQDSRSVPDVIAFLSAGNPLTVAASP